MKGPRELKRYVALHRNRLKASCWDDLIIFKMERCKKWKAKHFARSQPSLKEEGE